MDSEHIAELVVQSASRVWTPTVVETLLAGACLVEHDHLPAAVLQARLLNRALDLLIRQLELRLQGFGRVEALSL